MITKATYEEFFRYHQFKRSDGQGWLNESETIASCDAKCYEKEAGTDLTSTMLSDIAAYSNTMVKYKLKAGTAGSYYRLKITVVTSNNQKFEDWLEVKVI